MAPYCSSISEENQENNNSSQSSYDLYGIINHRGTAWFGHYTSHARLLANNDPVKTDIGREENLEIKKSHILFYRLASF
jgi:ubiquitin C-terminal hydrolase